MTSCAKKLRVQRLLCTICINSVVILMTSISFFIKVHSVQAQELVEKKEENPILDFSSIKDLLKRDQLQSVVQEKAAEALKEKKQRKKDKINAFNFPNTQDFWTFVSELWLVKNSDILKWERETPDFGIEIAFKEFLESIGKYGHKFKILVCHSKTIFHFALPAANNEHILVLSMDFIKNLDLSKLQISLLLYEDFLRSEANIFKNFILNEKITQMIGSNYYEKPFPKATFDAILPQYDRFVFENGFNFKQQFQITKTLFNSLASKPGYQKAYLEMIRKKDELVKTQLSFKMYPQVYPSPELQMNWLISKKETH